jgi:hypothetical protein
MVDFRVCVGFRASTQPTRLAIALGKYPRIGIYCDRKVREQKVREQLNKESSDRGVP